MSSATSPSMLGVPLDRLFGDFRSWDDVRAAAARPRPSDAPSDGPPSPPAKRPRFTDLMREARARAADMGRAFGASADAASAVPTSASNSASGAADASSTEQRVGAGTTGSGLAGISATAREFEVVIRSGGAAAAHGPEEAIVDLTSGCLHEVAVPAGYGAIDDPELYAPPAPRCPARQYPFTLDPFQAISVACLERGDSVLVSAHTSAGKTVVAEYAIAMALRDGQRVIYTSPIKALSNQKYRELMEKFQDVGLMTGDVTINPSASCLVMTTEILRSMLYRGSEVMREVAWVIFDEIHYMRDAERGVVWEETLVLLPNKVRFVFLSATIPNAREFASWITWLHHQPCHLVYTEYRPTPLQHYLFPQGGNGLHLVVDDKATFREENFQKAVTQLGSGAAAAASAAGGGGRGSRPGGGQAAKMARMASESIKIVRLIMDRNFEPVIVFSFSKKDCEALALQTSKLDFNDEDEKPLIEKVFTCAIESLSEDDRQLPQVAHILPLLQRGIGIHHSGLLPILKEVIEILFQEGLIKVLFATETFAMGLNMPAKTVVFTSVRKFDGSSFRFLLPGEYIQMSGRAGRRGLDDRGIVILMLDEKIEPAVAKNMLQGHAEPLNSAFHITYNMLLNLTRIEGVEPEHLVARSFRQFQSDRRRPDCLRDLRQVEDALSKIHVEDEALASEVFEVRDAMERMSARILSFVRTPRNLLPFLQPGRLVRVHDAAGDRGWGVFLSSRHLPDIELKSLTDGGTAPALRPEDRFVADIVLPAVDDAGRGEQVSLAFAAIDAVSSVRLTADAGAEPSAERRAALMRMVSSVQRQFPDGLPLLDPIEDMKIDSPELAEALQQYQALENRLRTAPEFRPHAARLEAMYKEYRNKHDLLVRRDALQQAAQESDAVILSDELRGMKRVLRRLVFVDRHGMIQLKGRVACEINANDSLLLTELIFNGVLNDLSKEQIVALMSTFVSEEKSDKLTVADDLAQPLRQLQEAARRVASIIYECGLTIDVEEYVDRFQPHMMDVVYAWARGAKFSDICKMTNIFEGSIIRVMRRLEELLRQLCAASKAIGNGELENKCAEGISLIKRDIVFAVSLYT